MADWIKPLTPVIYNVFCHFYPKSNTHIQAVCRNGAPKLSFLDNAPPACKDEKKMSKKRKADREMLECELELL